MKFIFPILAILVCAGAAYFSLSQDEKFATVQKARIEDFDTNTAVTAKADSADSKIVDEKAILATAKDNLALVTQSVSALTSDGNQLSNDVSKLDSEIAGQDVEFVELQKALEQVQILFQDLGGDVTIENLAEKITEIEDDIKAKRTKVEELDTLIEGAKSSLVTRQDSVKRLIERENTRTERISRNAMQARVTAVNQDWGFLVIGAGSNSGFTPQTSLLVTRDGRLIGKVKPSAIEPTQTIAEIDMKSLSPGVRLQPGDRVILAKPSGN